MAETERKVFTVKFKCIDDWNRPVFKSIKGKSLFGSTDVLFPDKNLAPNGTPKEISDYFRKNPESLTYFGTNVDDDPMGSSIANIDLIIID